MHEFSDISTEVKRIGWPSALLWLLVESADHVTRIADAVLGGECRRMTGQHSRIVGNVHAKSEAVVSLGCTEVRYRRARRRWDARYTLYRKAVTE